MKKLNLIKRLWTDSHEKQSPQRFGRYAAMLIMLLTLGVGQMWASTRTIYFDTGGNSFKNGATYLRVYTWSTEATHTTLTLVSGTLYSANVPDNNANCIFYSATSEANDWSSKTGQTLDQNSYASSGNLFTVSSVDSNGDIKGSWSTYSGGGSSFSVVYNGNGNTSGSVPTDENSYESGDDVTVLGLNTLVKTNYVFAGWSTANDGTGTYYAPGATFSITAATTLYAIWVDEGVLEGTYVMAYCGELTGWNQSTYKFTDISGTQQASVTISGSTEVVDDTYKTGAVTLDPNITYYNQGHSGWSSGLDCAIQAGYLYVVRDSKSSSYFTQKDQSGSDYLYEVSQQNSTTPATRTVTTTLGSSSFVTGTSTLSVTTTGSNVPGKSVIGYNNNLLYFLDNGSSWSLVTLSAGNLDVSSLTAGHYELVTVLYDGFIYVKADKDDFNVYDTWAMYSGDTKIADFTTTDGVHYSITDLVINNENNANTNYRSSCNVNPAQAGALSLLVNEASARALTFDNGRIAWQDGNGTFNIYIDNNGGWKIYASKTAGVEEWYWIAGNGAQTGSEDVTKQVFEETATAGVYTLTRTIPQDQTFHFGNTIKGYGPNSTARGGNTSVSVTPTSSDIGLEEYGSVYWFQFNSAEQPVVMTLNTNTNPYTISFSNPVYTITYQDQGGSAYSGSNGSALPTSHTYGTATDLVNGTKDGYAFRGWFTTSACTGDAVTSLGATAYSNDITLYAKWGENPSLTGLVLSTSLVTTGNTFTATPTIDAGDGRTTIVCWEVQTAAGVKLDPQPSISPEEGNAVTITAPAAPSSYKVVATLKEGTECEGTVLNSLQRSFTVEGSYTVTITNGSGSSSVGEETTATATANAAAAGMKFDHWTVVSGTMTSGDVNSRTITFNASSNITLTAVYVARTTKKVYFAKPSSWDYYQYYTDNNGEGDDKSAQNSWDKIVFNDNGSNKTSDLTIADGHFYHKADGQGENGRNTATISGSASAEDWYVCGYWNQGTNDWGFAHPVDLNGTTSGSVVVTVTASRTQEFKIYRASTDQWFKWTGGPSAVYDANYAALIGEPMTLRIYNLNRNTFTSYATEYLFTLDITSTSNPVLTVVPNENTPYSATLSKNGHGSLSVGTGAITLKQYIPTTITATPEPGYRFTGWTTTGSVAYAGGTSPSSATASFTATASDGTITANFSNSNIIYFDRSAVNGVWSGSDVYVTFFTNNEHWEQYNDATHGAGKRVKMTNYVSTLHNLKMNRIPNTNIYYLNTNGAATQWYMFTDKNMPSDNETTWNQAAVARADFSSASGCNMFVVENHVEKTVANTGYFYGYWMKYHEEDPGVQLCIYSSGSSAHISGSPFTLTTDEIGSTEFTESVHLSAATTYAIELKGLNGIYYKNRGTMTSKGSSGWEYVEREATRGYITTTAEGDYKFTLSCANQLILSAEYPLDENDFQIVFNGKVKTTDGSNKIHPSRVIRHLTEAGTQKDTISFFVIKDNDWSLQIQKCSQVNPEITWENVGSAISPAAFGDPATGVYNFVVEQTHDGSSNSVLINTKVEKYDGHFYIRSDAAKGGWEGYKKALDNQMIYSNYSKLYSDFDYYHCSYRRSGNNVKFTIANDYSSCVSDTTENDTYVTSYGNLPADASVRFMWNSETNVLSRAYLNGSHTTDFLLLEAKSDSLMNIDGSAIAEAGTVGSIKFRDMGNWIYQKEVQALPGTRVRLTSNYRFGSPESSHIQYFKGESGDWSETGANTEQIIGGTTVSPERLRLVYDFKTNHLTSAWLPPTSTITDEKSINADMLLIRRGQNAAQQLTFGVDGKIANVKTIVGAMEFVKDSIVGRVSHFNGDVIGAGGNRANRELMHYISFPFDVAVNDIYGFGQLNKEWYLQYYDGAERASKGFFRGDGTTTFWKYMTLADTLRANVGYSLLLDNDYFNTTGEGTVWHNTISDSIYLYFPSAKELSADSVIKSGTKTIRVPEHKHTSGRTFEVDSRTLCHDFTDSDWNMMGVPLFQNQTGLEAHFGYVADPTVWPGDGKGYFYEWDSLRNNFEIHTAVGYTFKSMHGYMVQYSGSVSFTGASIQPASSVVARRAPKSGENYLLELQLLKDSKRVSRTYVELREEACDTFALDEDVYMVYTSHPADLYTYAGNYDVSANVLSMDNHSIPVGIEVHQVGEYTFTMPSSFNGAATLIDTQTGARTNLALGDYTVSLPKGVCDGRFFIELDLNKMPTAIDGVTDGSGSLRDGNAHKFIENGIMYILRDGILYDARGNKVK